MSERTTDERFEMVCLEQSVAPTLLGAKAIEEEANRARRVEQEQAEALKAKDATIQALADALEATAPCTLSPEVGGGPCWCPEEMPSTSHTPECIHRREVLRLAGRLP